MFAVITDPAVGGSFLTWSIYYLSGKTQYFSAIDNTSVSLVNNPLTEKNAHAFVANSPRDAKAFELLLTRLINTDECMYMHQFRSGTNSEIDRLCNAATKIVVVELPKDQILYHCSYSPRSGISHAWCAQQKLSDPNEIYQDFIDYFYPESKQQWDHAGLRDTWDKREFIALNIDPFDCPNSILSYINQSREFYHIAANVLWTNFDQTVRDLFEYLELTVDESRFDHWSSIYSQWKNIHTNRTRFVDHFDTIINNILLNVDFDLLPFELDIRQEAAIQHVLIYKHNLNLKTWQLDKFTNTKQLHKLLEPNTHDLSRSQLRRLTA